MPPSTRCGLVAIAGRPNVGKSTLLNRLVGEKLAIISPKPATTRVCLRGVLTLPEAQVIFVDTPGIQRPHSLLEQQMVRSARQALLDVDAVLALTAAPAGFVDEDRLLVDLLREAARPALLLINKVDVVEKPLLLPLIEEASRWGIFSEVIPISATAGDNCDRILPALLPHLPGGPFLYPPDHLTDLPDRFFVGEMVRETALHLTRQEIPHALAVVVEEMADRRPDLTYIKAALYVEKASQKAIVIGKKGAMLKAIGQTARAEIERWLGRKVYLDLWVIVEKNWRRDEQALRRLGLL